MHLFLQAHSHKWNTKEELGKDKHETPTRRRLLVVVGTEIFAIATEEEGHLGIAGKAVSSGDNVIAAAS